MDNYYGMMVEELNDDNLHKAQEKKQKKDKNAEKKELIQKQIQEKKLQLIKEQEEQVRKQ